MPDPLAAVLEELELDSLEARTEAVLGEDLYWFPVRHHSPAVARQLLAALAERKPAVVFIEAPSDSLELLRFVVDSKTKPPVALYSSYRDDDNVLGLAGIESPGPDVPLKVASWYPLLPYSPEYVAMKEAKRLGAEVVFIDLPYRGQLLSRAERGIEEANAAPSGAADEDDEPETEEEMTAAARSWESLAVTSSFFRALAAAAGYRSWNECWDALFEAPEKFPSHTEFRRSFALFCGALRASTPRESLVADGTLLRETHMWNTIASTLAARGIPPSQALVVCGGFHLFMAREVGPERALPAGTVYRTLSPYSYTRVSELTGYDAGNRAPAYYARLHEHSLENPAEAAVRAMVDHVVAVLSRARKSGELLSSADAISVTQHARMLASLRGRSSPTLDDVRDALVACCCKGSMAHEGRALGLAMTAVETGSAIGRVTADIGRLPLVHDFYHQLDVLGLGETLAKEARARLTLDLRNTDDERRSILFHRLTAIEVPYVELMDKGSASTLFRETWQVAWTPKVDAALAEQNLHGDSIEAAALARLDERLLAPGQGADEVAGQLLAAVKMDLPGMVQRLEQRVGSAVDQDGRLVPLANALSLLLLFEGHARRKGLSTEAIENVVERCFGRACFALPYSASAPAEEHEAVVSAIASLAELTSGERGELLDRELFVQNVKTARADSQVPFLRGALSGVLTELREKTPDELAAELSAFANAGPAVLVTCGEFLSGVLRTSRTALLLGADAIVAAIDLLLQTAAWDQFLVMLPRARGAFEAMHERVRVSLADRVALRYGLRAEAGDQIAKLDDSLASTQLLVTLDQQVAEMMQKWDF